jgi:aryl-alcohol dehydrogenase-like predicted oxidoreductase
LVKQLKEIANEYQTIPSQIALAWLLRQGNDIVPIPGTKHVRYLEENISAYQLSLPDSAWLFLDSVLTSFQTAGLRYPEEHMQLIDSQCVLNEVTEPV